MSTFHVHQNQERAAINPPNTKIHHSQTIFAFVFCHKHSFFWFLLQTFFAFVTDILCFWFLSQTVFAFGFGLTKK